MDGLEIAVLVTCLLSGLTLVWLFFGNFDDGEAANSATTLISFFVWLQLAKMAFWIFIVSFFLLIAQWSGVFE